MGRQADGRDLDGQVDRSCESSKDISIALDIKLPGMLRSPPSFLLMTNFVKFFGHLADLAETWILLTLNLLMKFDPGQASFCA